ncbi:UDP-2,3-diacylglucosamine diphosphatase [Oxalicibacterium faecigallinarum]|uniref:UDP-2,3-diacylglucosamine hydrolase n=1 Tax=Oxalicibacterium faecigallinarum TaxID=573741 RepID=A0A8J3AKM5_9BURK|nr:UDP-2,3-diacylglucosamine diphosphatase [Oxalicibacterium faecigallinarum]GGI16198.1 UDP-2,3-diacylglucosamine hydrolase [Oxalicibacterium faecigallinarum]
MSATRLSDDARQQAQPTWAALFVSDLHLQPEMPNTAQAFLDFLQTRAHQARQLYLLGDIFEAWPGDDDLDDPFHARVAHAIRDVANQGTAVFWIAGNRDFLVGEQFAQVAGLTLLPDPFVTTIADQPFVLTHGDAYCTDDTAYMQFRAQVRMPQWQAGFLALPLAERKRIIAELRAGSRAAQKDKTYEIMDVNDDAIDAVFKETGARIMIQGHTHRPASHLHMINESRHVRHVLSDWDLDGTKPRGDWLAIDDQGRVHRYGLDGSVLTN